MCQNELAFTGFQCINRVLTRHLARRENWKKTEPVSEPSRKIEKKPSQLPSRAGKLEKSRASFRAEPENWKKAEPASESSQAKTARAGPSHKPSRAKYVHSLCYF
jgi:Tfp pilus assembly protein FimV